MALQEYTTTDRSAYDDKMEVQLGFTGPGGRLHIIVHPDPPNRHYIHPGI